MTLNIAWNHKISLDLSLKNHLDGQINKLYKLTS
jgi:hypothetical protein